MMNRDSLQDKCRGSLVGGAIGDAFGYPVEFIYSFNRIRAKYGPCGITEYDREYPWLAAQSDYRIAMFSDDTQMTLYTAEGIIESVKSGQPMIPTICNSYIAWYGHQEGREVKISYRSALSEISELNQRRAPGSTCISALKEINAGRKPQNSSKGCGGIMRIAPIAIYGATHGWTLEETGRVAGEAAELTHLHKMSTIASAAQAMIIQSCILTQEEITAPVFKEIVENTLKRLPHIYPDEPMVSHFNFLIEKTFRFENDPRKDWEIIETDLGEGWVAEETLVISVFSVLRHITDFKSCMISAVNHGGDSDSTGAVAGNIIGAILGYSALPHEFTRPLQLHDLIIELTDSLQSV